MTEGLSGLCLPPSNQWHAKSTGMSPNFQQHEVIRLCLDATPAISFFHRAKIAPVAAWQPLETLVQAIPRLGSAKIDQRIH